MNTGTMKKIVHTLLALLIFLQPFQVSAATARFSGFPLAYQDEGMLVRVPAAIGDVAGGLAGSVFGIAIGAPLGMLLAPVEKENIVLAPVLGGYFFWMAGRLAGGTVTGAPFLVVQKLIREMSKAFAAREYWYRNPRLYSCS